MAKLLIALVVFAGTFYLWGLIGLPGWVPVSVLGHGLSLRLLVSGALACVAFSGQK